MSTADGKAPGLSIGIVCEREEGGLGRVKVRFPTKHPRKSGWCRVAVPFGGVTDQGETYGYQWVPNLKDEVVVAHYEEDTLIPVVLGTVSSTRRPPPTGDPDERVIKSSRGDLILMSEKGGEERILVQTAGGQKLEMVEKGSTILIANGHTITLSGEHRKIEIRSKQGQLVVLDDDKKETTVKAPKVIVSAGSIELVRTSP